MARALRYKCIGYGVMVLFFFILQSAASSPARAMGHTPEFMLLMTLAVCFRESETFSGYFGLICGFLSDIAAGGSVGLRAVFYMFLAYVIAVALQTLFRPLFLSYVCIVLGAMAVILATEYSLYILLHGQISFVSALLHTILPRFCLTGVWSYIIYYIVYRYNLSLKRRGILL